MRPRDVEHEGNDLNDETTSFLPRPKKSASPLGEPSSPPLLQRAHFTNYRPRPAGGGTRLGCREICLGCPHPWASRGDAKALTTEPPSRSHCHHLHVADLTTGKTVQPGAASFHRP